MSIADKLTTIADNQEKVYEAGKSAEWNAFWDGFQTNGTRTNYDYAFVMYKSDFFKPKHNMSPNRCQYMFYNYGISDSQPSLKKALDDLGITLDTSASTRFTYMFWYSWITEIPTISTVSAANIHYIFSYCQYLHTVDKLILKDDGSQTFTGAFEYCSKLANIVIEGVIGNTLDMSKCPLTKDSFTGVINALSSSATGKTATFKKSAKEAAFTADEWSALIGTKSNWTISLV